MSVFAVVHACVSCCTESKTAATPFLLTFHLIHFAGGEVDGDDIVVVSGCKHKQVTVATGREESHVADAGRHCHLIRCLKGTW